MTGDLNEAASYCPTCGAEYRAGFDVCADDGTPLVQGPQPPEPESSESSEAEQPLIEIGARWQKLAELRTEDQARLLAGRLEAEGIPVTLSPDRLYEFYGRGTAALLGKAIEVYVPENRLLEAREIVIELERA